MSVIATAVKHLLAAGVTGDALVQAIAEMEASQPKDAVAEKRRAYDRERKRAAKSTGIPPESTESAEIPSPSPSSSPDPSTNPTPAPVDTPRARKAGVWPVPDGVEPRHWSDFLANRKRKKLTNSETAHEGVLNDLAKFSDNDWPPGKLVQHAAAKGWGSINYPSDPPARIGNRNEPLRCDRGPAQKSSDGFLSAIREAGEIRRAANH